MLLYYELNFIKLIFKNLTQDVPKIIFTYIAFILQIAIIRRALYFF